MTETKIYLPFTKEDIDDAIKRDGTLYDWLDVDNTPEGTAVPSGDYDLVIPDPNKGSVSLWPFSPMNIF